MILGILQIAAAIITVLVGLVSMLVPTRIGSFTGLQVAGNARGVTEVRAVLGGLFVALGLAPLIWRSQAAPMYLMLGFSYLVIAGVRTVSMFVDGSLVRSNIISVLSEVILGVILIWPIA